MADVSRTIELIFKSTDLTQSVTRSIATDLQLLDQSVKGLIPTIAAANTALNGLQSNLGQVAASTAASRGAFSGIGTDLTQLALASDAAERELGQLATASTQTTTAMSGIDSATASAAAQMKLLESAASQAERALNQIDNVTVRVRSSITGAGTGFNQFAQGLSSLAGPSRTIATSLALAEAAVVGLTAKIGVDAVKAFTEYESNLVQLDKLLDTTKISLEEAETIIAGLSREFGESNSNITATAAAFAQAGKQGDDVFGKNGLLTLALQVAASSELDLQQSTEALITTFSGLQAPVSALPPIFSALNIVSDSSGASLGKLTEGFSDLAPIIKATGLEVNTAIGLLTPITESFQSGAEASRALRTGLLRLLDPTDPVIQGLNSIGISSEQFSATQGDINQIVRLVGEAFLSADESIRGYAASNIFGKDQAARLLSAFVNYNRVVEITAIATDELDLAARALATGMGFTERAATEFATSLDKETVRVLAQTQVEIDKAISAFNQFQIELGRRIAPTVDEVAQSLATLFDTLRGQVTGDAVEGLALVFDQAAESLNKLIQSVAKNLPAALEQADLSGFEEGFSRIFSLIGDGEVTVEELAEIITNASDAFRDLQETIFTIGNILAGFGGAISDVIEWFKTLDEDTQKLVGTIGAWTLALGLVSPLLTGAIGVIKGLSGGLFTAAGRLATFTTNLDKARVAGGLLSALRWGSVFGLGVALGDAINKLIRFTGLANDAADLVIWDRFAGYEGASLGTLFADAAESLGFLAAGAEDAVYGIRDVNGELIGTSTNVKDVEEAANNASPALSDAFKPLNETLLNLNKGAAEFAQRLGSLGEIPLGNVEQLGGLFDDLATKGNEAGLGALQARDNYVTLASTVPSAFASVGDAAGALQAQTEILGQIDFGNLNTGLASLKNQYEDTTGAAGRISEALISDVERQLAGIRKLIQEGYEPAAETLDGWRFAAEKAATEFDNLNTNFEESARISKELEETRKAATAALEGMTIESQEFTEAGQKVNQALETEVDALNTAAKSKEDLAESTDKAAISNEAFGESAEAAALREQGIIKIITEAGVEYRKLGEAVDAAGISAEQSGDKAKEGADKTKKSIEEATKEAIELKVALLDLEGIKVQAQAEVNVAQIEQAGEALVAQIEQQTEVSVANIESIGKSIESTGDLLGELFDAFNEADSAWDQSFIEDQIRRENRRREDLLELQREQAEAVIRNLDARTAALKRGDALIKIEAQNLIEPLEVIWLEIMRQIQIRASDEGAQYLLSIAETSGFTQGETGTQSQSSPT